MARESLKNTDVDTSLASVALTADQNCASVDRQGFPGVQFVVNVGVTATPADSTNYWELEVEESDDDSTFTDCANADITPYVTGTNTGTFAKIDDAAEDATHYRVAYMGDKRYVRVVINETGDPGSTPMGVTAHKTNAAYKPTTVP